MTLYLDASVIVPLFVSEPATALITTWLDEQTDALCVGGLAIGETGSAISRRRRMGQLSEAQGAQALATFDEWSRMAVSVVDTLPGDVAEAALLVRRPVPKLLMPDAIHLATCRRLGYRLVTVDVDLTRVAELSGINWATPTITT